MKSETLSFKQAISLGQPRIGLWLSLAEPYAAEVCATAGFHWLLLDAEHAPNDLRSLLAQLQALKGYPVEPVVRLEKGDAGLIKQALDIGARNLLIPMVDTAEQARALVRATRYPPNGIRGIGGAAIRASMWGQRADYLNEADDEVCLIVQAETAAAMQNIADISAVDGVHGVFIGPADLAASLGHRGNPRHPEVQMSIDRGIQAVVGAGKAVGIITGDHDSAARYIESGASFVAVGVDVMLLAQAARRLANSLITVS